MNNIGEKESIGDNKINNGILKKLLDKDGNQVERNGTLGYEFIDEKNASHIVYTENTLEELLKSQNRYNVEFFMLHSGILKNADSYNVQVQYSQYGYIGYIDENGKHVLSPEKIDIFRNDELKKTSELSFNGGILKKSLDKKGKQLKINGLFLYEFTDRNNEKQTICSENTFEELSKPENKTIIEKEMLKGDNLRRAKMYHVQQQDSQFGYVGHVSKGGQFILSQYKINKLRSKYVAQTRELFFFGGKLRRKLGKDGNPVKRHKTYGYEFTDRNGNIHNIYSENTFEEFSKPNIRSSVEKYMLNPVSLKNIDSYDINDEKSQFGYAGNINVNGEVSLDKLELNSLKKTAKKIAKLEVEVFKQNADREKQLYEKKEKFR